jgi:UDP-4-amino-4-deoxy-L-arabinose formyltransferase/UDP-glucuronic acid dehydrogenase (UDP-4-keto-hexauronic acid decarboxylating)
LRVLIVAEESAGIQVVRLVAGSGHETVGVLTAPATRGGGATVATVAEGLGLRRLESERVKDPAFAEWIRGEQVDLLLNVHSLFVIHPAVVAAPRVGSFNLHPGRLPGYAGLNAPSWAIYRREASHGVTLHWMEAGIDTGAIAYEHEFELGPNDTGLSVSMRCVTEGLRLVERLLEDAERAAIPARPQPIEGRRYFGRGAPEGGLVSWARSAHELEAFVRACDYFPFASPWGHPQARLGDGRAFELLKVSLTGEESSGPPGSVGDVVGSAVRVATGDQWLLAERVRVDGEILDGAVALTPGSRLADGL